MSNCRSLSNFSTNFYSNSLGRYAQEDTGKQTDAFFKQNCSRCPMKCLMKNELTPPDDRVVIPDLSRQWLTQPTDTAEFEKLEPAMEWRIAKHQLNDFEWDVYAEKPRNINRRADCTLADETIALHGRSDRELHPPHGADSGSAIHALAQINDLPEFLTLNTHPMSV